MKNRTVFAFLAGFATCCAALYAAGNHSPAIYFALGSVASSIAHLALGMASNRATRRFHRRDARMSRPATPPPTPDAGARRKCGTGTFTQPASPIEADVTSALTNWGTTRKEARELARQAITAAGTGASFEQVIRLALKQRRTA